VVWVDSRHYYLNKVLYADRFSSSGQPLWQVNGKKLGDEHIYQSLECQVYRVPQDSSYAFRWAEDVFSISHLTWFGFPIGPDVIPLDSLGTQKVFFDSFDNTFMYPALRGSGRKCTLNGTQLWPNLPFLTDDDIMIDGYKITTDGNRGMIFTWKQDSQYNIRMSRVYIDGHVGGDTTAINEDLPAIPDEIKLHQNYPNPFNSTTLLTIDGADKAEISIFDITGRKITTLQTKNGKAIWNAAEYSSGFYFARLEGQTRASTSQVVKLILLK
jgi:hypothetical protein